MSLKPNDLGRAMYESAPGDDVELPWDDLLDEGRQRWIAAAQRYEAAKLVPSADEICDCPTCGKPMRFDPEARGTTCGGLDVVGALVCCANWLVCSRTRAADSIDWKLAKGGRSLDCGGIRLRGEGDGDVVALLARVAKLPALEREAQHQRAADTLQHRDAWGEDDGPAIWWLVPIQEPPYVGTPLDDDFPEYVTHWTRLPDPRAP